MNKLVRGWSVLTVKSFDEDTGIIEGIATTPETDRVGDIVEPKGAMFKLPIPLLRGHNSDEPIGEVFEAKVTKDGIPIKARVRKDVMLPYIQEAWLQIKSGLIRGLSIGFRAIDAEPLDPKDPWAGIRFKSWEWLELSAVTVPANAGASIHAIKSAAFGAQASSAPGVSGKQSHVAVLLTKPRKDSGMNVREQIAAVEAKRAANTARMAALAEVMNNEGRTMSAEEAQEFDDLDSEVRSLDGDLVRLKRVEQISVATATPVTASDATDQTKSAALRGGQTGVVSVQRNLPKATAFTRYAMALAHSKGNLVQAEQIARRWKDTPEVEQVIKAAVSAGSTTDAEFATELYQYTTMVSEFIEVLRPATIIGRMPSLRRVPFNIRVASKTTGSSVGWVGQGKPKPVSEMVFGATTLGFAKAAGIVVITQELARFSSPSAEALVRDDLVNTMAQFLDEQFVDPAVAAVANVSPASITNGLTPVTSAGSSLANIYTDVQAAFTKFTNANLSLSRAVWIMNAGTAMQLTMKRTSQDVRAFPDISLTGGTWFGLPVLVSDSVPSSASGGAIIVLVDPTEVFLADDGGLALDVSQEASLQMDSAPSDGAQTLVSLWQNNLIGIRAERFINWDRRRDAAVTYIDQVNYA